MANLPEEITVTINSLKQQSLNIIHQATAAEFALFELFGETQTVTFFEELKNVAEDATASFTKSNLQLRIAEAQPIAFYDTLELLTRNNYKKSS